MFTFKEKARLLIQKYNITEEKVIQVVFAITTAALFLMDSKFFNGQVANILLIFEVSIIAIAFTALMVLVGFRIVESLVKISAGLSLLLFIADTYCKLPSQARTGDDALKALFAVGLMYLFFSFFRSLWTLLTKDYGRVRNEKWSWEKIVAVSLYVLFAVLFVTALYKVMHPIIVSLCIY